MIFKTIKYTYMTTGALYGANDYLTNHYSPKNPKFITFAEASCYTFFSGIYGAIFFIKN